MATIDIFNFDNEKVGSAELADAVFNIDVNEHLLYQVVRYQMAKRRQGTHAVKRRSDVSGGGRKPFKQKGTGRARQGTTRAAQMRGGGVVFGPEPRDHSFSMNKKERRLALKSAISRRAQEGKLVVLDEVALSEIKTKQIVSFMERFGFKDMTLVDSAVSENVSKSARNIPTATVLPVAGLNVYDVLLRSNLVVTKSAVDAIVARLGE